MAALPDREAVWEEIKMYLCDYCEKGQLEMCQYFRENFLESENPRVTQCPEFKEMEDKNDHS